MPVKVQNIVQPQSQPQKKLKYIQQKVELEETQE
jgi:hypothetical protein